MKKRILATIIPALLTGCATNESLIKVDEFLKPLNLTTIKTPPKETPATSKVVQDDKKESVSKDSKISTSVPSTTNKTSSDLQPPKEVATSYDTVVRAELAKSITDKSAVIRALTKARATKFEEGGIEQDGLAVCYGAKVKNANGVYGKEKMILLIVKNNKVVKQLAQDTSKPESITQVAQICETVKNGK